MTGRVAVNHAAICKVNENWGKMLKELNCYDNFESCSKESMPYHNKGHISLEGSENDDTLRTPQAVLECQYQRYFELNITDELHRETICLLL